MKRAQPRAAPCSAITLPVSIAENLIYHALLCSLVQGAHHKGRILACYSLPPSMVLHSPISPDFQVLELSACRRHTTNSEKDAPGHSVTCSYYEKPLLPYFSA